MVSINRNNKQGGFSLVELIVVLGIIALLTAASAPAISGLTSSGTANENISQLSGILEQAREYAVSQNVYVWVAFNSATEATGPKQVTVAVIASTDGRDPGASAWPQFNYGTVPSSTMVLVNRIVTLKGVSLENASKLTPSKLPSFPTVSESDNSIADNSSGAFFSIVLPGQSTPTDFTQAIEFTPSGQARNNASPIDIIDLDVQPQRGTADDPSNVAVLRVNGLTGETVVYRQ